jgi:hypothetical protein
MVRVIKLLRHGSQQRYKIAEVGTFFGYRCFAGWGKGWSLFSADDIFVVFGGCREGRKTDAPPIECTQTR